MTDQEPKGRPTPKRSDARASRRMRTRLPSDPKAARKAARTQMSEARMRERAALYTGDDRLLPSRDQGPIRKRIRQMVDSRLTTGEVFLPVAVLVMVAAFSQNKTVILFVNLVWTVMLFLVIADGVWTAVSISRMLRREFPAETRRSGHIGYGVLRSLTMRMMRLPKPRYGIGGKPREPKVPKAYRQAAGR